MTLEGNEGLYSQCLNLLASYSSPQNTTPRRLNLEAPSGELRMSQLAAGYQRSSHYRDER
jgi:hypothetical protein